MEAPVEAKKEYRVAEVAQMLGMSNFGVHQKLKRTGLINRCSVVRNGKRVLWVLVPAGVVDRLKSSNSQGSGTKGT